MAQHNDKRMNKMRSLRIPELIRIRDAGTLSSAAAQYEILRRNKGNKETISHD